MSSILEDLTPRRSSSESPWGFIWTLPSDATSAASIATSTTTTTAS